MAGRSGDFRFFQGIHVRTDISIDISISIADTSTGVDSNVTNQAGAGNVTTSRSREKLKSYLHYQRSYQHQPWQDRNLPRLAPTQKVT